ncbi:MAG: hypothetical protein Q8P92_00380 [Candidatus Daviesbacteria bacterium]|nr:hypothetical protein [Candidatus Daviesbacteria bacterium]
MDNNNQTQPQQPQATQAMDPGALGQTPNVPGQPVTLERPNPGSMDNTPTKEPSSNKTVIMIVTILIIAVILAIGGYYLYMNSQTGQPKTEETTMTKPTPTPSIDQMEGELNAVNVEDVDKEFTQVDQDLQKL